MNYKICAVAARYVTIKWFMLENLKYLTLNGFDAHVVCNDIATVNENDLGDVKLIASDMKWGNVTPVEVIKQTYKLFKLFKREKYDIIQFASFNASLYAAIAGWLARVPVRINCQWGISYPIYTGWQYYFRKFVTLLLCRLATNVQPDSKSNLQFSIENKLYPAAKANVLFNGSACGVDLKRYDITKKQEWKSEIRKKYSIPDDALVYGYVGRIEPEKGVNELLRAFLGMDKTNKFLFIVGSEYGVERMDQELYKQAKQEEKIIFTGQVDDVEKYDAFLDFLILPSWQEGFGLVLIEAAAVGTPSIITDIKGPKDLIDEGVNGYVCDVKSELSLREAMLRAASLNKEDYAAMSNTAYEIAKRDFDSEIFKQKFLEDRLHWIQEYEKSIK